MNKQKKFPVSMNWVKNSKNYNIPILYDQHVNLIDSANYYLYELCSDKSVIDPSQQSYRSEIELHAYSLKNYFDFLSRNNTDWADATDKTIEQFRDDVLLLTLSNTRSKNEKSAKRTTNRKLRIIYRFYAWAQKAGIIKNVIGKEGLQIKSTIYDHLYLNSFKINDKRNYPLCYDRCGEGSRSRFVYSATNEDKRLLINLLIKSSSSDFIAIRNILVMELADQVGWRNGSITSLTINQFSDDVIRNAAEDKVTVTPSVQKLDYENAFDVPLSLAVRINKFIKNERAQQLLLRKRTEKNAEHAIFINSNKCTPIGSKTFIQLFSSLFKQIGRPKGSGIHSFRRKFAQDITDKEIAYRTKHNLSLAIEDTLHIPARLLGQSNLLSHETYVKAKINQSNTTYEAQLLREKSMIEAELTASLIENKRLKKLLEDKQKNK